MRVTVLRGGPSSEREVSLRSGAAVARGLREAGHEVVESDVSANDLTGLDVPCDVVFPVLHGAFGEDGALQRILESRGLPFVGSDSVASALAIDKLATKRRWIEAGLPTPRCELLDDTHPHTSEISGKAVVKSLCGGSSIGVRIFDDIDAPDARQFIRDLIAQERSVMVEQFVQGTELTVGVLDDQTLPPIRIVYAQGFFDYQAKYSAGGAEHRFDTGLDDALLAHVRALVLKAHQVVGCRDLSRTDVLVDASGAPFLIEINTMPGFTERSLLPEAAQRAGIGFPQLVDRLINLAWNRSRVR